MKIINGKMYEVCHDCGKIIQLNKFLFGSIHICTTDEEKIQYAKEIDLKVKNSKKMLNNTEIF